MQAADADAARLTRKRTRRVCRLLAIFALSVPLLWQILARPLPVPVLHAIVGNAGEWMVDQSGEKYSGVGGFVRRLTNLWIEHNVIQQMHNRLPPRGQRSDLALLQNRLLAIHPMLINQMELPHQEILSSTLLVGAGKCTGMNTAAAQLLAQDFNHVQMLAIDGDKPDSGHAFGRIWSTQYKDWLYFDLWTAQIQVFTASRRGAKYLWQYPGQVSAPQQLYAARTKPMHDRALHGRMRLKIQRNFGRYLWYRIANMWDHGSSWERDVPISTQILFIDAEPRLPPDPARKLSVNTGAHGNEYLTARLHHLLGETELARQGYRTIAKRDQSRKSAIGAASEIFAARLAAVPKPAAR
jgi:hypothetical protein